MSRNRHLQTGTKVKTNLNERIMQAFIYLILIAFCLLIILPCLNVLALSFNDGKDAAKGGVYFWPREWTLDNYNEVFKDGSIMRGYIVTVGRVVVGTTCTLLCISLAAFALKEKLLPGGKLINFLITFTMLFGGGLVPSYNLNVRYYHLRDTFWILLIPGLLSAYWVIILRTFIKSSIPEALFDSARIDGAGHFTIFFRIVCPLFKAGLGTIGLFSFVARWNDWFMGMLYIDNNKLVPLQTLLTKLQNNVDYLKSNSAVVSTPEGLAMLKSLPGTNLRMACTVLAVVPVLFAYPFFQRYFVQGLTVGSIKE